MWERKPNQIENEVQFTITSYWRNGNTSLAEGRTCLEEQTGVKAPGTPTTTTFYSVIRSIEHGSDVIHAKNQLDKDEGARKRTLEELGSFDGSFLGAVSMKRIQTAKRG